LTVGCFVVVFEANVMVITTMKSMKIAFMLALALASTSVFAFWGKEYEEPPPIVRTEPLNLQEVQKLKLGNRAMNDQPIRFGLARHVPLIPDWSKANSGKLLASWTPNDNAGKHAAVVLQHGGIGGPGSTFVGLVRVGRSLNFEVQPATVSKSLICIE